MSESPKKLLVKQQPNIVHQQGDLFLFGAVGVGTNDSVTINQNDVAAVVEATGSVRVFFGDAEVVGVQVVNFQLVAVDEAPAIVVRDVQLFRISSRRSIWPFTLGQIVGQEVKKNSATYTFPLRLSRPNGRLSWST